MVDINPYQILGVSNDANLETVTDAYKMLAQIHHPDKGGDPEVFKHIRNAYKQICDSVKKGVPIQKTTSPTYLELKNASMSDTGVQQLSPENFFGRNEKIDPNRNFDGQLFNQLFTQKVNGSSDYVFNSSGDDYRQSRTKEQLLAEQKSIESDMASVQPIFNNKEFNPNVFNRLFEQVNGTPKDNITDMEQYHDPSAITSGLQPYTEIDANHQLGECHNVGLYASVSDSMGRKNPEKVNSETIKMLSQKPDITDVSELEGDYHQMMQKRIQEYKSDQCMCPHNPADINNIRATPVSRASMNEVEQQYNQMLNRRNDLTSQMKPVQNRPAQVPVPVMDHPQNSNGHKQSLQTADYFMKMPIANQSQQYGQQVTQQMSPQMPPQFQYRKSVQPVQQIQPVQQTQQQPMYFNPPPQPSNQSDLHDLCKQVRELQRTVKRQNNIISKMNRPNK